CDPHPPHPSDPRLLLLRLRLPPARTARPLEPHARHPRHRHLHGHLRRRGAARRHQHRAGRPGGGGPCHRPAVRAGHDSRHPAAGVPLGRAADDERVHRAAEEHHRGRRLLDRRAGRPARDHQRRAGPSWKPDGGPALGRRRVRRARAGPQRRSAASREAMEDRTMSSVLYDVPGPRAIARNRILAVLTVVVVLAVIGFILYRMVVMGQFAPQKWYVFTFSNVWMSIFKALGQTLGAFALAAVLSLVLGFVLAIGRLSEHAWVRVPVTVITELFRAVPVLVFMMLLYYGLPVVGVKMDPYWAVVLALMVYNGSVLAEVLRAGIESLPRGQKEAGYAIGLRKAGVMQLILLPQAIRAMLPVIVAQLVVTLKDTALGFIITYPELLYYAKLLSSQQGRPILQSAFVIGEIGR